MGRSGIANSLHTVKEQELVPGSPAVASNWAITLKTRQAQAKPGTTWKRKHVGAILGAEVVVCRSSLSDDEIMYSTYSLTEGYTTCSDSARP